MVFTAFQARKLNPEEVNPFAGAISKAIQGYGQGMHAAYLPKQIEADIFAKQIGPLATLATTPAFLQNPQFQAALGQIIAKHLGYGQGGGQGGQTDEMPTYAGQTKKDVQDAESLANDLSRAGKVKGYISSAGGGAVNYLGDIGKHIIGLLPGGKAKELVDPALAEKTHQFETFLNGLKNRALQTQALNAQQAEEVFSEHKDENAKQRLARIKRTVPSLFQQNEAIADEGMPTDNNEDTTAMDVEEENNNDNRDLTFASQLSEQIKEKTGHDISPDLIFNYMKATPGKISIPLLLKAAGVR